MRVRVRVGGGAPFVVERQEEHVVSVMSDPQREIDQADQKNAVLVGACLLTEPVDGREAILPSMEHQTQIVSFARGRLAADGLPIQEARSVRQVRHDCWPAPVKLARLPPVARLNGELSHLLALLQHDRDEKMVRGVGGGGGGGKEGVPGGV